MTESEIRNQLSEKYDRVIADTLKRLKKTKPLTKQKLAAELFKANEAYWTARLALLDTDTVFEAERVAAALSVPYMSAMETFANRVRSIYTGYKSAFDLSEKDAKELLDKVVYDRSIAENLKAVADSMPDGEEKTRILAEISAPAYRYRLQRAEQMCNQAKEVCENIRNGEIPTVRNFLQTETERAYNISLDEALGKTPADTILEEIAPEPIQIRINEMPKTSASIQEFTPTTETGIADSFSLINTRAVNEIVNKDWIGSSFSERIWNNTDELAKEVKQVLIQGELTGASEAEMAAKVAKRFEVGMYEARRVVRTESNYCTTQAELKSLTDAGFDEYEFLTVHEEDVCDTCDDLDGMRFKLKDGVVGVNMPPLHPFCRCRISAPEETEEDIQADIDRMLEGTSIEELERKLDQMIAEQEAAENSSDDKLDDEPIDSVKNGDLEQIRDFQLECKIG